MNNEITSSSMGGWTWDFNIWPKCYKVIRKVNTILPHIDGVRDMNSFERMEFRAKCRFLRTCILFNFATEWSNDFVR